MKDRTLESVIAVLILFLGFEISNVFNLLLNDYRNYFINTLLFLILEICLNIFAIIFIYLLMVTIYNALRILA